MIASDLHESMKDPVIRGQYLAAIRNRGKDVLISDVTEAMDLLIEMAVKVQSAERERDDLKRIQELNVKIKQAMHERFTRAEAEIARRDAAASEPVGYTSDYFMRELIERRSAHAFIMGEDTDPGFQVKLYTDAPPAVLPPEHETMFTSGDHLAFSQGYNKCRTDAMALGAQPQKPVAIPSIKSMLTRDSFNEDYATCMAVPLPALTQALDAAGIPYEVKK